MARLFITGGAGFIGYFITKQLIEKGHEVIIYDALINYVSPWQRCYPRYLEMRLRDIEDHVQLIRGDIRYRGLLEKTLHEVKPDIVIHLAAIPIATVCNRFSEDALEINLNGTVILLEAIRNCNSIKRFVYTSSSFAYGDFQYEPADEQHPTSPIDIYGGTKLSGEILTKAFSKQFGVEYTIIRPSAVYGPTDPNQRVSQKFIENAFLGKPLVLHNGGADKVDFTYVEDTATGFVLAAFSPQARNETFNITRGEGRSIKEFAQILSQLVPNVTMIEQPPDEIRPSRGALDISKARALLGYQPKYSLEDGLKLYVNFVRESGVLGQGEKD